MKKVLSLIGMVLMTGAVVAPAAKADIIHTISASTQLRVDAAATDATRIGSTYSVQGTNITAGTMGGLGQANETTGVAATHSDGVYTVTTAGDAFSLTESFIAGDKTNALGAGVDVTAHTYTAATTDNNGNQTAPEINSYGTVMDMPAYGQTVTSSGGHAGSLAGTIATDGAIGLTAGGAGTTATGQVVTTLTIN
tara:strand:+ start:406 stop:990 length:585 start_codon:yes stop_codon:yes gene_type:complete